MADPDLVHTGARQQVERLLSSAAFSKVETVRRLFSYLADQALAGRADTLKEYTIGLEAFGKPPEYDTQQDPSVRICASKLRQKLDEYYRTEGADDPLLITLPKGSFRVRFEPARPVEVTESKPGRFSPDEAGPMPWRAVALVLAIALIAAIGWALYSVRRHDRWSPALEALWAPFLNSTRPIVVSMGTPLFLQTPWGYIRHYDLRYPEEQPKLPLLLPQLPRDLYAEARPNYSWTGYGDATGAFRVAALLGGRAHDLRGISGGWLTWDEISNCNVIFLGSQVSNAQIRDLPLPQDLLLENGVLRNLHPQSGEPAELRLINNPSGVTDEYAVVTQVAGLNGTGQILILAGMTNVGTIAAAEAVTDARLADELVSHLRQSGGALPRQYDAVLHVRSKEGVPLETTYAFHHVIGK